MYTRNTPFYKKKRGKGKADSHYQVQFDASFTTYNKSSSLNRSIFAGGTLNHEIGRNETTKTKMETMYISTNSAGETIFFPAPIR